MVSLSNYLIYCFPLLKRSSHQLKYLVLVMDVNFFENTNLRSKQRRHNVPTRKWEKSPKKQSLSIFLTKWHCNLSAKLTQTHSFRLYFLRFCQLGRHSFNVNQFLLFLNILFFLIHNIYQASDADSGQNGDIIYVLANSTSDFSHFVVNSTTGVIGLIKPLDFEAATSIELGVTATDLAVENQHTAISYLTVNIEVNNVNMKSSICTVPVFISLRQVFHLTNSLCKTKYFAVNLFYILDYAIDLQRTIYFARKIRQMEN